MLNKKNPGFYTRRDDPGEFSFKFPDTTKAYAGECQNMSGASIVFRTHKPVKSGQALEITINGNSPLFVPMVAYVEIIRAKEVTPDVFEVSTEIKGIKVK